MNIILIIIALILPLLFPSIRWIRIACIVVIMFFGFHASLFLYTGHRVAYDNKEQTEDRPFDEKWIEGVSDMSAITQEHASYLILAMLALAIHALSPQKQKKATDQIND